MSLKDKSFQEIIIKRSIFNPPYIFNTLAPKCLTVYYRSSYHCTFTVFSLQWDLAAGWCLCHPAPPIPALCPCPQALRYYFTTHHTHNYMKPRTHTQNPIHVKLRQVSTTFTGNICIGSEQLLFYTFCFFFSCDELKCQFCTFYCEIKFWFCSVRPVHNFSVVLKTMVMGEGTAILDHNLELTFFSLLLWLSFGVF